MLFIWVYPSSGNSLHFVAPPPTQSPFMVDLAFLKKILVFIIYPKHRKQLPICLNPQNHAMTHQPKPSLVKIILLAGLIAGALDITAACVNAYINNPKVTPDLVLRGVASGVFGPQARTGGNEMIFFGLLFHFIIATGFAALFVLLSQKLRFLTKHFVISGLIYGIVVWAIMSLVVVPLSQVTAPPIWKRFVWNKALVQVLILMFMIGLPIAWVTKHYSRQLKA
jgi:hypothetical protein